MKLRILYFQKCVILLSGFQISNYRKEGSVRPLHFRKVSRHGYFFEGLTLLVSTFCVCADGFHARSFNSLSPSHTKTLLYCPLKPSSKFPFLQLVDVLQCRPLICCVKCPKMYCFGGFRYDLQDHRRLSVCIFRVKSSL